MKDYLNHLNKRNLHPVIDEMIDYAVQNKVPIIDNDGMEFINQILKIKNPKNILEIGTAIGYSAINMALSVNEAHIDTIERNPHLAGIASENIRRCDLTSRIELFIDDALEIELNKLKRQYDVIFIDGAKSQYQNFFKRFSPLLTPGGIIISDNILFHGLVTVTEQIESRNLRQLVHKIKDYNKFLANNKDYHTTFYNLGDGIAISIKVK